MSLSTLVKLAAGLVVLGFLAGTGLVLRHVMVGPVGGVLEKWLPGEPVVSVAEKGKKPGDGDEGADAAAEGMFLAAREDLVMGRRAEAREKFSALAQVFSGSDRSEEARRVVGEMNIDAFLAPAAERPVHVVGKGESLSGIAARLGTTVEYLMEVNGLMSPSLRAGERLAHEPLDFRLLIEYREGRVSLWRGGRFFRGYPVVETAGDSAWRPGVTKVALRTAVVPGSAVATEKSLTLARPAVSIRSRRGEGDEDRGVVVLAAEDLHEIHMLMRVGDPVEFR
jgi:LysM repeat protein